MPVLAGLLSTLLLGTGAAATPPGSAGEPDRSRDITLEPAPSLTLDPSRIDATAGPDEPVTHTLTIGNPGSGELTWNVVDDGSGTPPADDEATITHSASDTVRFGNSDACRNANGVTVENAFLRTFVLDEHAVFSDFQVSHVTVGIETILAEEIDLTINLHQKEVAAPLRYEHLELVGSHTVTVAGGAGGFLLPVEVPATVSAGTELIVELVAADLSGAGDIFLPGSNNLGQSAPTYIRADECGWEEPTDVNDIRRFPDMQLVMSVAGTTDPSVPAPCAVPAGTPWAEVAPRSGTVEPGGSQEVSVTIDATGLSGGDFQRGLLCLETNDPEQPLALAPITLEVVEVPVVEVTPEALAASQPADSVTTQQLTVHNPGHRLLEWEVNPSVDGEEARQRRELLRDGVLLIPDDRNNRVMAFDQHTGDLIDADFVPTDPFLALPTHVILDPDRNGLLVSDAGWSEINAYDLDGEWQRLHAPAGGPDTSIMHSPRSMRLSPAGTLLVPIGLGIGDNQNAVAEFDTEGNFLGNFIDNGAGGLRTPRYLLFRESDILVSGGGGIHRFGLDGSHLGVFSDDFLAPAQLQELPNGNILAAELSVAGGATPGIREFSADGELIGSYRGGIIGHRGVYELPNGNILTTNRTGVHEIERGEALVETKISNVRAGLITHVQARLHPCELPEDVDWLEVSPIAGTTPAGGASEITVTFDSTGLADGLYETELCVESNDPQQPQLVVPVTLTVGDGGDPEPEPEPEPEIDLQAEPRRAMGEWFVDLAWSGATSTRVDVVRNGAVVDTVGNSGEYTDALGKPSKGRGFGYRVCEQGTDICSEEKSVVIGEPGGHHETNAGMFVAD